MSNTEYIYDAAQSQLDNLADMIEEYGDTFEAFDAWALEVDVLHNAAGRYRVEILTTLGGPTVWWVIDSRRGIEFHHSWGVDADGNDCHEIDAWGLDTDQLEIIAESLAEIA